MSALLEGTLRLYPAAYRREHGAEIAATYADATDGAGSRARAREAYGLAGHALRTRTGFGSDRLPGRIAAAAAPFAVASGGALAVLYAVSGPGGRRDPAAYGSMLVFDNSVGASYALLPWLAVLAAALVGRWAWARGLALLALAGAVLAGVRAVTVWRDRPPLGLLLPQLVQLALPMAIFALIVLAAPPDLPASSRSARTRIAAVAVLAGLPLALLTLTAPTLNRYVIAAIVLGAMVGMGPRRVQPPAILLTVVPWLLIANTDQLTFNLLVEPYHYSATDLILLVAVVSAALALSARAAWERLGAPARKVRG